MKPFRLKKFHAALASLLYSTNHSTNYSAEPFCSTNYSIYNYLLSILGYCKMFNVSRFGDLPTGHPYERATAIFSGHFERSI